MTIFDAFLGGLRTWRRMRRGIWLDVSHVPSAAGGWIRLTRYGVPSSVVVHRAEDYTLPRARALP